MPFELSIRLKEHHLQSLNKNDRLIVDQYREGKLRVFFSKLFTILAVIANFLLFRTFCIMGQLVSFFSGL